MKIRGERVRDLRKEKGWSQTTLAEVVQARGGRLAQTQVGSIENNMVERPKCLPELASALGTTPDYLLGKTDDRHVIADFHTVDVKNPLRQIVQKGTLDVWKVSPGGGGSMNEVIVTNDPVDSIERLPGLENAKGAFAFRIADDLMDPAFREGDTIYVDPAQRARPGDDCVIACRLHASRPVAYNVIVRHLLRSTPTLWIVQQFKPSREIEIPKSDWPEAWKVQGKKAR